MFLLTFWNKQNVILLDNNNVEMLYVTETGITKEDASHKTNIDIIQGRSARDSYTSYSVYFLMKWLGTL